MRWLGRGLLFGAVAASAAGLAAAGGAAGEFLGGMWGAAVAGTVGFVAPAVWDHAKETRAERAAHRAAVARLEELSEQAAPRNPARGAAGDVIDALNPARGVVEFTGRQTELDALTRWATDEGGVLALVTGAGGVGKTRLALQLAGHLNERGWSCRWVRAGGETAVVGALKAVSATPALLIVDYAETRADLRTLIASAASAGELRLRVLLLARGEGEWWERLRGAASPVGPAVNGASTLRLAEAPHAGISSTDLVREAVPQFARHLGMPVPDGLTVRPPSAPVPLLVLHAAALVAVLRHHQEPGSGGPPVVVGQGVLDELLRHERRYWYDSAQLAGLMGTQGLDTVDVQQCVAVAGLIEPADETAAADLLRTVPGLNSQDRAGLRLRAARWLSRLYPGPVPGSVGAIQPDLPAEHHIVTQLHRAPGFADAVRDHLDGDRAVRALTVLARAHAHQPPAARLLEDWLRHRLADLAAPAVTVAGETPGPIGSVLADVLADADVPPEVIQRIAETIPFPTFALARAGLLATESVVDSLPDDAAPGTRARWLDRLGTVRSQNGDPAGALSAARQAVVLYRELAEAEPERFRPRLAMALNNVANRLADQGRTHDALGPAREAVAFCRQLAETTPESFRPRLAMALNNLASHLADNGRYEDALAAAREGAALHRRLAQSEPERFRPELANSLNNLALRLADNGRAAGALAAAEECVALCRQLAETTPGRFRPNFARALANLAGRLAVLGRKEEALARAREAADLLRQLADAAPERFRPELAMSLNNLAKHLGDLGRAEEALAPAEESVAICRELAAAAPGPFRPNLALSLHNLSIRLAALGRDEDALAAAEESVALRRELAEAEPERFRPRLARSLESLALRLTAVGRTDEAELCRDEATRLE